VRIDRYIRASREKIGKRVRVLMRIQIGTLTKVAAQPSGRSLGQAQPTKQKEAQRFR
jgi:hypothetical protein